MSRTPRRSIKVSDKVLSSEEANFIRKIVKQQILVPSTKSFRGCAKEHADVLSLFRRAMEEGESNSALLIGPRGCGKSAVRCVLFCSVLFYLLKILLCITKLLLSFFQLVESVIKCLESECEAYSDSVIVRLNGYVHTDDRLALKGIATQLQLENTVGDRVFGSFAGNIFCGNFLQFLSVFYSCKSLKWNFLKFAHLSKAFKLFFFYRKLVLSTSVSQAG